MRPSRFLFLICLVFTGCPHNTKKADEATVDRRAPDARAADARAAAPDVRALAPDAPAAQVHVELTVLVDNTSADRRLASGWGYACLVTGMKRTVLFDTGMNRTALLRNMARLSIVPQEIDLVVLSHDHHDHTAGLGALLRRNPSSQVCLLSSFRAAVKKTARRGAKVIEVGPEPVELFPGARSLGSMGKRIPEQALALDTPGGVVLLTGCGHPGIVAVVKRAKQTLERDILLVMGGFHLVRATPGQVAAIVDALDRLGVRYVGPSHCTGDRARAAFKKRFKERYLEVGAGTIVRTGDLKR